MAKETFTTGLFKGEFIKKLFANTSHVQEKFLQLCFSPSMS